MKLKPKLKYIIVIINLIAVISICIITFVGKSMTYSQQYNFTAERWKNNNKKDFEQISAFLSEDSGFTTNNIDALRSEFLNSLNNISIKEENGNLPFADAYSSQMGTFQIRGDLTGRSEAVITAVGGDFFLFRNFKLVSGSFFTDNDLMHDGVVIDRNLAWKLYGSYDVIGMNLYINGIKFYISGVIELSSETEKNCIGNVPRIYISYKGTSGLSDDTSYFNKVSCYETVLPNPVEHFGYNMMKNYFSENYKNKYSIVNNSTRFDASIRAKAFKNIADYAIIENNIIYPYWENSSRLVEFKLTFLYFIRRILFIIPLLTVLYIIIVSIRFILKKKPLIIRKLSIFIDKKRIEIKKIFKNK